MANLTLNEALEQGIKAHKAGNAHEADRFYTMILQVNPLHADANHNMGVLAMDLGRPEEAIPFLTKALEANSDFIIFWESLAEAMLRAKKYPALKTILEQAYARRLESHKLKILNDKLQKLAGTMVRTTMDLPIAVYQKLKLLYEAESYEEVLLKITQAKFYQSGARCIRTCPSSPINYSECQYSDYNNRQKSERDHFC